MPTQSILILFMHKKFKINCLFITELQQIGHTTPSELSDSLKNTPKDLDKLDGIELYLRSLPGCREREKRM